MRRNKHEERRNEHDNIIILIITTILLAYKGKVSIHVDVLFSAKQYNYSVKNYECCTINLFILYNDLDNGINYVANITV